MAEPVRLELTGDVALVLFEYLARWDDGDTLAIQDQAEERALWAVQGQLERQLAAIFHPDYRALVAAARDRVRDPVE